MAGTEINIHSSANTNFEQITLAGSGTQHQRKGGQVSEEFISETMNHLRAVLLSSKEGLTPKQILYDYIYLVGEPLPYLQLGHPDLVSFLDNHQSVCERFIENGQMKYRPVLNSKCEHIRRLVESQKSDNRKPRNRKRKSISINDEIDAAPKRSKSDTRNKVCPASERNGGNGIPIDSAPRYLNHVNNNALTPNDQNKSVHFEDLLVNTNKIKPRRQRSRTRLPFFHKDDPGMPRFKGFRRRGKSTSSLPVSAPISTTGGRGGRLGSLSGKTSETNGRNQGSLDVVSSSNPKRRFTRVGNPEMVTSTPRRSSLDIPVPDDIRKNLLSTLQDFPHGVLMHEVPAKYKTKMNKDLPDFLSSSKALTEFFSFLTADVRVARQGLGAARVRLLQFENVSSTAGDTTPTSTAGCSSQSAKSRVVETLLRILSRYARGIFLSRLRVEYKKVTGEVIPFKRLGFVSERLFLASMPENFTLRTMTTEPGIDAEFIVSSAVLPESTSSSAGFSKRSSGAVVSPNPASSRSS